MNTKEKIRLRNAMLDALDKIICGEIEDRNSGICVNLGNFIYDEGLEINDEIESFINAGIISWPDFNGNLSYPISEIDPKSKYWSTSNKYTGEYGEARIRLAIHLSDYIQKHWEEL